MRISDWSSDVCSSDLHLSREQHRFDHDLLRLWRRLVRGVLARGAGAVRARDVGADSRLVGAVARPIRLWPCRVAVAQPGAPRVATDAHQPHARQPTRTTRNNACAAVAIALNAQHRQEPALAITFCNTLPTEDTRA